MKMLQDEIESKKEEKKLLSFLSLEVDELFLKLRKDYQVICREIKLFKAQNLKELRKAHITSLEEGYLRKIIKNLPIQLIDEYVMYMLANENNNIFKIIKDYNELLDKRKNEQDSNNSIELISINEKLADCLQQLGAMVYHLHIHLHIHLNLLTLWLRNTSMEVETPQEAIGESKEL